MNTPAHVVVNLVLLDRDPKRKWTVPVLIGSILPDAPMFVFYFLHKVIWRSPEQQIWSYYYYQPGWQNLIDTFNSIPIMLLLLGAALWRKANWAAALVLSMLAHAALDLPLHHDDAHRHFYPLSDWRFASPFSYWDPLHYGNIIAPVEVLVAAVCCAILLLRYRTAGGRIALAAFTATYVGYLAFAMLVWSGMQH